MRRVTRRHAPSPLPPTHAIPAADFGPPSSSLLPSPPPAPPPPPPPAPPPPGSGRASFTALCVAMRSRIRVAKSPCAAPSARAAATSAAVAAAAAAASDRRALAAAPAAAMSAGFMSPVSRSSRGSLSTSWELFMRASACVAARAQPPSPPPPAQTRTQQHGYPARSGRRATAAAILLLVVPEGQQALHEYGRTRQRRHGRGSGDDLRPACAPSTRPLPARDRARARARTAGICRQTGSLGSRSPAALSGPAARRSRPSRPPRSAAR